jgi:hypothetical protein
VSALETSLIFVVTALAITNLRFSGGWRAT